MTLIKTHTGTFKHIESVLYKYPDAVREIQKRREELMDKPTAELVGGKSNLPGDPTGSLAALIADDRFIRETERFTQAVEYVYEISSNEHKQLIKLKYWTKPQTKTWDGIAMEMGYGRTTLFRWRNEIIQAIGERLGWR